MKFVTVIALSLALAGLASCQSVPAERKNHCACMWQKVSSGKSGISV